LRRTAESGLRFRAAAIKVMTQKNHCHFDRWEKAAFTLHPEKADFSPDEAGFEMTVKYGLKA
jgi:hypothetical protein